MRKRFNELLGLQDTVEQERKRFVERVNQTIFHEVDTEKATSFDYPKLFALVCFELGIDSHALPERSRGRFDSPPRELKTLTGGDFWKTLEVLCAMHEHIWGGYGNHDESQEWLSEMIEGVMSRCTCDIGVRWKNGFFYPSGAEELDKPLIEDVLIWLKDYPSEEKDYRAALRNYMAGDSLADVIKNCYSAVEGMARAVLGNEKTLDNNKDALLAKLSLSNGWNRLLANYVTYAHDYRHANETRHEITPQEAEAYLYMTGLVIRLTIESKEH
ncbi:MAG: hypothetical protein JW741_13865 [Sedimentisphaerales bacterium]|nr:hypothetical protein [Sedimentisphaerales bacterium]